MTNSEQLTALARRLVACTGFRWLPGMLSTHGLRVIAAERWPTMWTDADGDSVAAMTGSDSDDDLPDLSDPLTRLGVLHLVREAWGSPGASSGQTRTRDWSVGGIAAGDSDPSWFGWGRTEAEALVAALEAAPAR